MLTLQACNTMGVPGFNTWFARHHRQAYVAYAGRSWDHLYIDMASILHSTMKSGKALAWLLPTLLACKDKTRTYMSTLFAARNLPHFHKMLFLRLDSIMALTSPKKSVMFAMDGPAPLAKLLTQRYKLSSMHHTSSLIVCIMHCVLSLKGSICSIDSKLQHTSITRQHHHCTIILTATTCVDQSCGVLLS